MTIKLKHNGVWKDLAAPYVKHNGVWKNPDEIFVRDSGSWKRLWQNEVVLTWRISVSAGAKGELIFNRDSSRSGEAFTYNAGQTPWPKLGMNIPTVASGYLWEFVTNAGDPSLQGDLLAGYVGFRYAAASNGATVGNNFMLNNWPSNSTLLLWNDTRNNQLEAWTGANRRAGASGIGNPIWFHQNSSGFTNWDNVPVSGDKLTLTVTIN